MPSEIKFFFFNTLWLFHNCPRLSPGAEVPSVGKKFPDSVFRKSRVRNILPSLCSAAQAIPNPLPNDQPGKRIALLLRNSSENLQRPSITVLYNIENKGLRGKHHLDVCMLHRLPSFRRNRDFPRNTFRLGSVALSWYDVLAWWVRRSWT